MSEKLEDRPNQQMRLCDAEGRETGETADRASSHSTPGKKHLAFNVFVINGKNQLALHRRIASKVGENLLEAPVSHVLAGETLEEAVHRCLEHEYSISERLEVQRFGGFSYEKDYGDGTCENEYCLVLVVEYDGELRPNPGEIDGEMIFMPVSQAIAESKANPGKFEVWFNRAAEVLESSPKAKHFL